jgi:hypothetical protein
LSPFRFGVELRALDAGPHLSSAQYRYRARLRRPRTAPARTARQAQPAQHVVGLLHHADVQQLARGVHQTQTHEAGAGRRQAKAAFDHDQERPRGEPTIGAVRRRDSHQQRRCNQKPEQSHAGTRLPRSVPGFRAIHPNGHRTAVAGGKKSDAAPPAQRTTQHDEPQPSRLGTAGDAPRRTA